MNFSYFQSLKMFLFLSLLTGVFYPLFITLIGYFITPYHAQGSLILRNEHTIGSTLIGQKFTQPQYFWGRPSAVDYNPLPSGGSNLSPTSAKLRALVNARASLYKSEPIPPELLFASGSGLDPHISPEAAAYQIERVSKARGLDSKEDRKQMELLVQKHTSTRFLGIIGRPVVNVLSLNLALDEELKPHGR